MTRSLRSGYPRRCRRDKHLPTRRSCYLARRLKHAHTRESVGHSPTAKAAAFRMSWSFDWKEDKTRLNRSGVDDRLLGEHQSEAPATMQHAPLSADFSQGEQGQECVTLCCLVRLRLWSENVSVSQWSPTLSVLRRDVTTPAWFLCECSTTVPTHLAVN